MNVKLSSKKLVELAEKYKYALLVLLLGLVLLLLPSGNSRQEVAVTATTEDTWSQDSLEEKLAQLISSMDRAGRVQVALTLEEGAFSELAEDVEPDGSLKTVTVQRSEGGTEAVVVKNSSPKYRGALVVCDGGNIPEVRLNIVEAVCALTGLSSDRVTVVKMQAE